MYLKVYFIILERNNYFVVLKNTARETVRKNYVKRIAPGNLQLVDNLKV